MTKSEEPNATPGDDAAVTPAGKKSWRTPELKVYGDLQRLALAKGGKKKDGTGKPVTKA